MIVQALKPTQIGSWNCGGGAPRSRKAILGSKQTQETGHPVRPTCKQRQMKKASAQATEATKDGKKSEPGLQSRTVAWGRNGRSGPGTMIPEQAVEAAAKGERGEIGRPERTAIR
jgi:hypothetical protein